LPFVHLLALSFSSSVAVKSKAVTFIPVEFNIDAYAFAFQGGRFMTALFVSIRRVIVGILVNLTLIVLTAYPLSHVKEKLRGRNIYMTYFVITMIVSGGMIPTYLLVTQLGLLNSIWSLILPGALPIYSMIIMMNFIRGLPEELKDAAMIDSAGAAMVLFRLYLPLLTPSLATVGLFAIVAHWNDWFSGLIYMQNYENYPLQTYLQYMILRFDQLIQMVQGDYSQLVAKLNARSGRAAQLFMGALPVALIYPFLQKYFTTGLVLGSVKG
jgi:putative aldouronate transport system permease protein